MHSSSYEQNNLKSDKKQDKFCTNSQTWIIQLQDARWRSQLLEQSSIITFIQEKKTLQIVSTFIIFFVF